MKRLPLWAVLPTLFVLHAANFMDRAALGVLGDTIRTDMGFSDAWMGFLHSALLFSLPLYLLPAAVLNDIVGRRRMLSLAAAVWSAAMLAAGSAATFFSFAGARFAAGVNEAFSGAGSTSWLATVYPPRQRGRVLGLFLMCCPFGMAMGTFAGSLALDFFHSWRVVFLGLAVPGLTCALLIPFLPDSQPRVDKGIYVRGLSRVWKSPTVLLGGLAAAFYNIILFSWQSWTPSFLARAYGQEYNTGLTFGVMLIAGAAGAWAGGMFTDWWQNRREDGRVRAGMAAVALTGCVKLLFFSAVGRTDYTVMMALGLLDAALSFLPLPILFSIVQDVADDRYRSMAMGLMGTLSFLAGGAWGPLGTGILSDLFGGGVTGMRLALSLACGAAIPAILCLIAASPTYRAEKRAPGEPANPEQLPR